MQMQRISRKRNSGKKRVELKIEVSNFGPISGGKVVIKPLTLFIGPNNSGKSYAAMLIHSIFESCLPPILGRRPLAIRRRSLLWSLHERIGLKQYPEFERIIADCEKREEVLIPEEFIEAVTNKMLEAIFEKRLGEEIVRSYACHLRELIRAKKESFSLGIQFNSYDILLGCERNKLKIRQYPHFYRRKNIKVVKSANYSGEVMVDEKEDDVFIKLGGPPEYWKEIIFYSLLDVIFNIGCDQILEKLPMKCYYLPAARSGILQGHKALAASIVEKAPYVGIQRIEIPKFSGVVADFISSVLTLPQRKGAFYKFANSFEKELIKGEIVVRTLGEHLYPEIKYSFQNMEIPLHRASSTVSELAPLFLYLKYLIQPGDLLIIEEPEAHLHPENQCILAKYLVKLIREDVNLILTTHSEYLLEQLSSFLMLGKVDAKKRVEKYKYSETDYLVPDEISAYVFGFDVESGGHKISEVEITEEDGISQDEFLKIHESLYEETFKLKKDLSKET